MVNRLPPTEKFPLALRKNIRDDWDNKKADQEKTLSEVLGTAWTIEVDPAAIHPYSTGEWAQTSPGSVLYEYFSNGISRIKDFTERYGEASINEINTLAPAHVLTMDFDEGSLGTYCGAGIQDGKLVILFSEGNLGTNVSDALATERLEQALNKAPQAEGTTLNYNARKGIREDYDSESERITKEAREILKNDNLTFNPGFEALFEKLKSAGKAVGRDDWDTNLGSFVKYYFEGVISQLNWQKFGEDDMLQEGFNEVIEKNEIAFRVVDKLERNTYNECVIEDGVLYVQAPPGYFGTNASDAAQGLVDLL